MCETESGISAVRAWGAPPLPPMGWNSWDCFGSLVTEDQVRATADYMAKHLRPFGWQYVVVDIRWYESSAGLHSPLSGGGVRDEFGRYQPAPNRFPSANHGRGFRPLADYVHDRGLRFGIHIMRGIPRQAVRSRQPVKGTPYTADQVADTRSTCQWNGDNYGVDVTRPGGQQYYDSMIQQFAEWGVDLIKADNMLRQEEIGAVVWAIDRCGRDIALSLVAQDGDTVLRSENAAMFRICTDVWDEWDDPTTPWVSLKDMFDRCARFAPQIRQGCYPDADMLPLGRIGKNDAVGEDRPTRLKPEEQVTLMTLWSVFRSPLMFGGNLLEMDDSTLSLLTNPEVLAVNQQSRGNRPLFTEAERVVWTAEDEHTEDRYLAIFNRGDSARPVGVDPAQIGMGKRVRVRDLWKRQDIGACGGRVERVLGPHASALLRLRAA